MPNTTPNIPNFPPQGIQAQLDLLYLYNPDAANALIAQLQAGLIEMKELEEEVKKALQDMQGVMRYKGSVPTEADLPTEGNVIGDVWNIIDTDENVAWDGEKWDKYGSTIDTSTFLTKDEAKNAYINADASTYTLATLQDAFNYSPARLYKIFNEDKMPTKNTYTLFSLGWTYNDTNNQPTLLANDLQTSKFYFYHGTYENCSPATWQEFAFGGDLAQLIANIQAVIPSSASSSNQLVTEEDLMSHTELPAQQGNEGKFLTTNGATPQWADVPSAGGIEWVKSIDYVSPGDYSTVYLTANLGDLANGKYSFYLRTRSRYSTRLEISKICKVELRVTSTKCEAVLSWVMEGDTTPLGGVPFLSPDAMTTPIARDENNNIIIGTQGPDSWGTDYGNAYKTNFSDIFSISEITNNSTGATTSAVELKYYTDQNANEYWTAIGNIIGSVEIPPMVSMPYIPSSITGSSWDIPEGQVLSIQNVVANSVTDIKIVSNDKTTFARITKMADGVYFKTLFINELGLDVKVSAEDNNTICFLNLSGGCITLLNSYGVATNYPVPNVLPISTPASFVSVQDLITSRTLVDNDIIPMGIGQIVQYIGATDSNYTNGYFYKATGTPVDTPESTVIVPNTEGTSLEDPNGYIMQRYTEIYGNKAPLIVEVESPEGGLIVGPRPQGSGYYFVLSQEEWEPNGVVLSGDTGDWFSYNYTPAHTSITDAKWEQVNVQPEGGSGLPEQTGHTGFLQTDGTDATWSDKPAIENIAPDISDHKNMCASYTMFQDNGWSMTAFGVGASVRNLGTALGANATVTGPNGGVAVGTNSSAADGVSIGKGVTTKGAASVAIGYCLSPLPQVANCTWLGYHATPSTELVQDKGFYWGTGIWDANTNKWLTYKLFDGATGVITPERLAVGGTAGQVLSKTTTGTQWVNMTGGGSGTDNNGLEGDYCSRYGIVDETQSGLPRMGTGNQVIIPAGLVLDVPGVPGLTTNASQITHDLTATTNCELWLAEGNVLEVTDMFWQEDEPEDGTTGYAGWWNGTEMKFKSNDTGNVWRAANAVRIAKCIFTDGNLTRLCFTGCRLLNKQEWLPLSGGALTGPLVSSKNVSSCHLAPVLSLCAKKVDGTNGRIATISMTPDIETLFLDSISVNLITPTNVGTHLEKVRLAYINKINNGANINVPATGGTMVVATPPTAEGTYVLKATVAADGTVTTTWVAE